LAFALASAANAQDAGEAIFLENCAICHQDNGVGDPPTFPALAGNANLGDLGLVVTNVHQGQGNMPPFPDLAADEVAAVASYVRTSWGNAFGAVSQDEVAALLEGLEAGVERVSVWSGVYTEAQAARGLAVYTGACGLCHGRRLNGAPDDNDMKSTPPLARSPFLREWDGKSLATLFEYTRATMPQNNPGYMDDQTYIDIIAHMLSMSNMPAGEQELPPDPLALAKIVITPE